MSTLPAGIKHIIVLMLENRSFDNILGNLPGVVGPAGCSNKDPKDGSIVPVTFDASYISPALPDPANPAQVLGDPPHDFVTVNRQLFELDNPGPDGRVTCGGFIAAARQAGEDHVAREVMKCFDTPTQLKTFAALAKEFVVCDRWFSSVPGPTWPNRLFAHAATSFGYVDNHARRYPGPTIYDKLETAGVEWAIYYHDLAQSACIRGLMDRSDRLLRPRMRHIREFYKDVKRHLTGSAKDQALPSYVFIEPGYFEPSRGILSRLLDALKGLANFVGLPVRPSTSHANDQHPPHDLRLGEHLIADVYEALRANEEVWSHCLLIVLHDEHGGLFDHVVPPSAVRPGQRRSETASFDFDRLGLRVPAILVSPYLKAGIDSTQYEHASIVSTVRSHFCPGAAPLNARDAAAATLRRDLFTEVPRTDSPKSLPRPAAVVAIPPSGDPSSRPPNEFQTSLLHLAASVDKAAAHETKAAGRPAFSVARTESDEVVDLSHEGTPTGMTEAEARKFVQSQMRKSNAVR
jgi:phospholipase C